MKSLNVVVCLLPTDDENLELCELVGDLAPMLHEAQMSTLPPPQVVLSLASADDADGLLHHLEPPPLVIPRDVTLASLLCEVLHPEAHWTGSLDEASISDEPDPVPRRGRDVEEARRGQPEKTIASETSDHQQQRKQAEAEEEEASKRAAVVAAMQGGLVRVMQKDASSSAPSSKDRANEAGNSRSGGAHELM